MPPGTIVLWCDDHLATLPEAIRYRYLNAVSGVNVACSERVWAEYVEARRLAVREISERAWRGG